MINGKIKGILAVFAAGIVTAGIGAVIPWNSNEAYAAASKVKINSTNFPDAKFRAVISGSDYDRNGDGYLSAKELGETINIHCEGMGIKSVKGVEFFTDLQGLWCNDNEISSMDLSKNKDLRGVWCSGNNFKTLDFSNNPELVWVFCFECKLTSINVSKNPKLAFLEINTNPLKKLDVTHNPELEHLTCGSCGLTSLDLSRNPKLAHLDAFRNKLKKLDVTHNPKMKRLDIWDNPGLGSIDVTKNPGLQYYNCANNDVKSINVTKNPELQKLICSYNGIKTLDLTHNPKLVYLDCAVNQIGKLDLSKNCYVYFLQAFTNSFTKLDIGYNPFLIKTYKEGVKKAEYNVCKGHSWTIDYGGDTSTGRDNICFLCFDDKVTLSTKAKYTEPKRMEGHMPKGAKTTDLITREAVAQTLYEMSGKPSVSGLKSRFKDVEKDSWYEKALLWGEKNAICVGYPYVSSDTFGTGEYIERQDLIFMLMRYAEFMKYRREIDFGRADDFMDYYDVDYYAWEAVTWASTWNIMLGKGDPDAPKEERKIDPHGFATRDDFKTMFNRMLEANNVKGVKFKITTATKTIKLSFDKNTSANIICGTTAMLKAGSLDASFVSWKSSDTNIATVDKNGKLTAVSAGSVTVTAASGGKSAKLVLRVQFKDVTVSSDFWYEPTYHLVDSGVVKGYDNQTRFKPSNECSRAQMVTFLWRLSGQPAPKAKTTAFTDVESTDYFFKPVIWAVEKGITTGVSKTGFDPQGICSRAQTVTFLWRMAGKPEPKSSVCKFTDVNADDYFYKAAIWASEKKILAGYDDNTFRPKGKCLRRQMVTFLYKYDKYI